MEKYADTHSQDADSENATLISSESLRDEKSQRRQNFVWLTLFNLFIFVISMLSMVCTVMSQRDPSGNTAAQLMDQFGIFSPLMHQVEYTHTQFSFASPLNSSKYVGTTDDVDDAWMDIAFVPDQMVSKSDFPRLNKPTDAAQVTDPKTGETGYRVGLEVFHQLHCLNLLRMATYPEHYTKVSWSDTNDEAAKVRGHLDHCIEVLRVNLMCLSDVNVFTFHPKEGLEGHWPDYNTNHVCRNFDAIKDYAREHGMPEADV
ncbi:hypothetical protein COCSADRAFT_172810 [Bipolaris sorokiniana ND90Pr]|uniref:Uncharacterized protein n=1 Tax=Cochliobolus sativus (strain ND90Pr / ATCC 201652) TaxID=665912 RepID=M2SZF9_COCSN|nr:uncharacterized protein COCSADRAFT_172810 [Bipolaris sorokiniana ND90Pr]EMD62336.1 hypothetical protein COCSADRAFT_172810 [Bipolaris sorokiniana ND90Pr]